MNINDLIAQLEEAQAAADLLRSDYEGAREAAVPNDVRRALAEVDEEFAEPLEAAQQRYQELEGQVREAVKQHGASVRGERVQAVWNKPRVSWDTKALDGYAAGNPEILKFRQEGQPSVSIRRLNK